jgi:dienelactone hydrolase
VYRGRFCKLLTACDFVIAKLFFSVLSWGKSLKKIRIFISFLLLLPWLAGCDTVSEARPSVASRLFREYITLPAQFKNEDGSVTTIDLDAHVIRPNDNQAHPLVVMSHGFSTHPATVYAGDMWSEAMEFARRGWTAVTFTRRGYGLSDGDSVDAITACNESVFIQLGRKSAEDIREVIRLMAQKSYVDSARVISVGEGAGGYASIALTAEPPPGLVAAINFSGGRSNNTQAKRESCYIRSLTAAAATFGKTSRIPTLWVYVENNHVITLEMGKNMYKAFTEAGGNAKFIGAPAFGNNGHDFFGLGASIWTPYVENFLQKEGLTQINGFIIDANYDWIQEK